MGENKIEILMAETQKDIGYIKEALKNNDSDHQKIFQKIDEFIISAEKKFAPIWVEKVLIWGGSAVGLMVLTALISLVIKK